AGPSADAGVSADVLLPVVLVGEDVADDSRRRLELPELLAVLRAHGLDIAFERSVEHDVAGGRQRARPHGEALGLRPYDLAVHRIPRDEVTHAAVAVRRRIHRQR